MKLKSLIVSTLSLGLLTGPVLSEEMPARFDFVRPLGMGGAFTAIADDHNAFNFNPAGVVQRTGGQWTLIEIAGGVSEDTLDAADFVSDNEGDLTNWENLTALRQAELVREIARDITKLNPRVYAAADVASYVSGPSFLGLPFHVGYGAFGAVDSSFKIRNGIVSPNISYEINNDIVIPILAAKRFENLPLLPGKMGVGVTGKYMLRNQVSRERQNVFELDDLESPPVAKGDGIGMDLGFLYQPGERSSVGVMVQDFLGTKLSFDQVDAEKGYQALPSRDTVIRPRTNIGIAYVPKTLLWLVPTTDRWTFAADVRDILNDDDHIFFQRGLAKPFGDDMPEHLYMGTEYRWAVVRLRGGFYQGYPSFGFGLDLPLIKLDYAYYSRELGDEAGDLRQGNHIASIALRFGSTSVEAHERIGDRKAERRAKKSKRPSAPTIDPASSGESMEGKAPMEGGDAVETSQSGEDEAESALPQ